MTASSLAPAPMSHTTKRPTDLPSDPRLLVAIPALNEERTIADVVAATPRSIPGIAEVHILVIDDGSTDATARRAEAAGADVLSHGSTRGVGAAFQTALAFALEHDFDLLVSIDADGQFNPAEILRLVEPVVAGLADFSTASRFKDPSLTPEMSGVKLWGNRMMSRLISRLSGRTFHDVSCGMRCYGRRALMNLNLLGRFTYTQEVFLNLAFKNLRIVEVPMVVRGVRAHGKSRVADNLWKYAFKTLRIIFRCYRDYHPLRFFGGLFVAAMIPAVGLAAFLLIYYARTGSFSPHKWAGFSAAGLTVMGLIFLHVGVIGDMLNRHRIYLEELLYHNRSGGRNGGRREMSVLPPSFAAPSAGDRREVVYRGGAARIDAALREGEEPGDDAKSRHNRPIRTSHVPTEPLTGQDSIP